MKNKNNFENKDLEKLLDSVAPRIKPDEKLRDEVFHEVHKVWLQNHKKPFYQTSLFRIAASLLIFSALFTFSYMNLGDQANYNIAQSLKIQGQIQISHDNESWRNLSVHKTINPGDYIATEKNNRLFVKLTNGIQFRLDENSSIKINSEEKMTLYKGRVYVDSDHNDKHNKLTIDTKLAVVNHIGTRYSVSYLDNALKINVRKGLVLVSGDLINNHQIKTGNQYNLTPTGEFSENQINPYDHHWNWTQKITEDYVIQGKTVYDYINWVSSESGYSVNWESMNAKIKSREITLSGSINGIMPLDSIEVIFPTTRFSYRLQNNQIYINYSKG